jgi:hypothetical protein
MSGVDNTDIYHPKHHVAMTAQQLLTEGGCRSFDEFVTEVSRRLVWCSRSYAAHVLEKWRSRIEADIVDGITAAGDTVAAGGDKAAGNGKHIQILNNIDHES